jgi:hypothetical protein
LAVAAPQLAPLLPGDPPSVGPYRVIGRLAEHLRGTVYLGRSEAGILVLVRVPRPEWVADPSNRAAMARALVSMRQAAGVSGIHRTFAFDLQASVPYVVGEFGVWIPVSSVVARLGRLPAADLWRLAVESLAALQGLHALGLAHLNVSPFTMGIGPTEVVLTDTGFGLPVVVNDSEGALRFAAPEQLRGERGGSSADLFGWAATIGFAASGGAALETIRRNDFAAPPDAPSPALPTLPLWLRFLMTACLIPDARRRPTAAEVLTVLRGQAGPAPEPGSSPGAPLTPGKPRTPGAATA